MHDEHPGTGGVPNAYRNAIFWRWAPELPRPLRQGFLTLLYVLGAGANTAGALKFRDGTPIRFQDIAKAVGSDDKDVRRYIDAAIAAGVVGIDGERKRGKRAVYVCLIPPRPNWAAAVAHLEATRPAKKRQKPAPWQGDQSAPEFGGPTPEPPPTTGSGDQPPNSSGDLPPNPSTASSGDQPPYGFGGPTPVGLGGPTPQQPMVTQGLPQEMAGLGGQPQDACARVLEEPAPSAAEAPPTLRPVPGPPGGLQALEGQGQGSSGQRPLLLPVRPPAHVSPEQAEMRAQATDDEVRRAIAELGQAHAMAIYGWRRVAPHLNDTNRDTGS